MKQAYLALAFLITVFLLAGNAYGEDEVYYCAETDSTGFWYNTERSSYERSGFNSKKFKMKLDRASKLIELATDSQYESLRKQKYTCETHYKAL